MPDSDLLCAPFSTAMKYLTTLLFLLLGALLQTACSNQAVYSGESFASDSPFRMRAEGEVSMACESARRALLGQGYLIESAGSESVKGRKAYRTEDTQNTFIEMNIVCLGEVSGSTLYATGVLTKYALKKSTSSASVGLSALGSISLPIGQSADSLVKVSEETIDDKDFYKRFFSAVDIILGEMRAMRDTAVPVAPEPGPAAPSVSGPIQTAPAQTEQIPAEPVRTDAVTPVPVENAPVVPTPARTVPVDTSPAQVAPAVSAAPPAPPEQSASSPVSDSPGGTTFGPRPPADDVDEPAAGTPRAAVEPQPAPPPATVLEPFAAPQNEPYR